MLAKFDPRNRKLTLDNFITVTVQVRLYTGKAIQVGPHRLFCSVKPYFFFQKRFIISVLSVL